jgi:hypothetical protein
MRRIRIKPLYRQIAFTLLAFAVMVVSNYIFNSRTVRENLKKNAEIMLSFTHEQIDSELISSKVLLGNFAETLQLMIDNGDEKYLQHYVNIISDYAVSSDSGIRNINGLYGYFENVFDEPVYIDGTSWLPPDDYNPSDRGWYKEAKANCGEITETLPYIDATTDQLIISYANHEFIGRSLKLKPICLNCRLLNLILKECFSA